MTRFFKFLFLSSSEAAAFPLRGHLHKGNTSRLASLPVLDHLDRHDTSILGEKGFEFNFSGLEREVSYINPLIHLSSLDISAAEALHTKQFFVIGWGNRGDDFLSAARTYDFVGFWMP
jgi:hypothetical protein